MSEQEGKPKAITPGEKINIGTGDTKIVVSKGGEDEVANILQGLERHKQLMAEYGTKSVKELQDELTRLEEEQDLDRYFKSELQRQAIQAVLIKKIN